MKLQTVSISNANCLMVQASRFYTLVLFNAHRFYLEAVKTELKIKCLPLADLLPLQWHLDLDLYQNDKFKYHHRLEEYIYLWNNFGPTTRYIQFGLWTQGLMSANLTLSNRIGTLISVAGQNLAWFTSDHVYNWILESSV